MRTDTINGSHVTLDALVRYSAIRHPNRAAVRARGETWSYAELDEYANRAARWLVLEGVVPGDTVAVWSKKSCRTVACLQAVLRIGAAYVPIDAATPVIRAMAIIENCHAKVIITESALIKHTVFAASAKVLMLDATDDATAAWASIAHMSGGEISGPIRNGSELAYVLYTSGSTGIPKGVCLSHINALSFINWACGAAAITAADVLANHASLAFDLSVFDLYCAFACGAMVSMIPEEMNISGRLLVEFLLSERISVWYSVPSAIQLMIGQGLLDSDAPHLHTIAFAGEPFPAVTLRHLHRHFPHCRILNFYGPTETNVCTAYTVDTIPEHMHAVPIGRPVCGNKAQIITDEGKPAGINEVGELWIEGPTVMLGYWGAEPHRGPYATGDLCKLQDDGELVFCGRRDRMVKLRGYRVELGEVETVLRLHPNIGEAAICVGGTPDRPLLMAFIVPINSPAPTLLDLKQFLADRLPRYMVVDRVFVVTDLPRTRNGKINYAALS